MTKPCPLFIRVNLLLLLTIIIYGLPCRAQSALDVPVSVNASNIRLKQVLTDISNKGGFYFSYDGRLIPQDSLVSITAANEHVLSILYRLFKNKYEFEERKNYIIITRARPHIAIKNADLVVDGNTYSVSGVVTDERTGEPLMNASAYEKSQLASTLTDEHGYFRLKFKMNERETIAVTLGKLQYKDTTMYFLKPVLVSSRYNKSAYANAAHSSNNVERTALGRLFTSTRQKIQSLNIPDFFAKRPFQVSLTPGLSTHGMFSPQVVNNFSVNVAGGYTAGVKGFEIGGLFNINKGDTKYLQLAGIFNLSGGNATGLQFATVLNKVLDTVKGAQLALFTNAAGEQLSGVQASFFHNKTRRLKGVQIGLVNVADTSKGVSIGMLNIIGNGFYRAGYSVNNISNFNLTLKTGTHAFYSVFLFSNNIQHNQAFRSAGLGIGHDFMLSDRFYISAEINGQAAYSGNWDDQWAQGKLLLNTQLSKNISIYAGPTLNYYDYNNSFYQAGYKKIVNIPKNSFGHVIKKWIGWEAGIAFNSAFKPTKKVIDNSRSWYIGAAATAGISYDSPYTYGTGAELSLQRDLGDQLTGIISAGYTHFAAQAIEERITYVDRNGETYNKHAGPAYLYPFKAGIRINMSRSFFIGGEIGHMFGKTSHLIIDGKAANPAEYYIYRPFNEIIFSTSAGFAFNNGVEAGIKADLQQIALRLGYRIKVGK